jgi:sugar lactone lactonase YvrE
VPSYRVLAPGQIARVHVHDIETGDDVVVHESREVLLEAPNWTVDGAALLVNGAGRLWSLAPEPGAEPVPIPFEGLPEINNDHVLDPRGGAIYLSAMDGHIWRGALTGGPVERITADEGVWHFLHGVSPDGARLAYVRMTGFDAPGVLAVIGADGGPSTVVDTGAGHIDGPEWTPDGGSLVFNTEAWATEPGHAQLARIPDGGGEVERLVESGTVDWFPHVSPDGRRAVYLEFPAGTTGHPADRDVRLVVVATDDWRTPLERIALPGGQGTINVSSWAPDSRRFAYVSYPTEA